jgi:hypothetical protein
MSENDFELLRMFGEHRRTPETMFPNTRSIKFDAGKPISYPAERTEQPGR